HGHVRPDRAGRPAEAADASVLFNRVGQGAGDASNGRRPRATAPEQQGLAARRETDQGLVLARPMSSSPREDWKHAAAPRPGRPGAAPKPRRRSRLILAAIPLLAAVGIAAGLFFFLRPE